MTLKNTKKAQVARKWYRNHRDICIASTNAFKERCRKEGRCINCGRERMMGLMRCKRCHETGRTANRNAQRALKAAIIQTYGGKCICCGESEKQFLTVDHIHNNGSEERRRERIGRGYSFYQWLKKRGFPAGYRILCFNCNCGRSVNGGICPHITSKFL